MRVPHEELTPQEVAERARRWAGILLGRPLVPNTIDPDWGRVWEHLSEEQRRQVACQ